MPRADTPYPHHYLPSSPPQSHFTLAGDNLGAQTGSNYGVINIGTSESQSASILRTLFLTNPKYDLRDILRVKGNVLDGTCEWILYQSDFLSWLGSDSPELLRLVGGPGVGKTMISTFLVANIEWRKKDDYLVAYYFCDAQKELRRTPLAVLRGLIVQILQQRPDLQRYILPDFEIMGDQICENTQALWNFILDVSTCKTVREMILLVDAVDELNPDSQAELASMLQHLFKSRALGRQRLKIIVTHRHDTVFGDQLEDVSRQIDINAKSTGHDIKKFIDIRVSHLIKTRRYSPSLSSEVRSTIQDNTKGTFLWASLILDDLESIKMNDKVKSRLQVIPKSLNGIYHRILSGIDSEDAERSAIILQSIVAARRPLKRKELATVCHIAERTIDGSQLPQLPISDDLHDLNDCYRCCGALLFLDNQNDTVNLTHQSVKDYLGNPYMVQHPALQHGSLTPERANVAFLNILIRYMYITAIAVGVNRFESDFRSSLSLPGALLEERKVSSLMHYATTHYCHHALSVSKLVELGPFAPQVVSKCPIVFAYLLYHSIMKDKLRLARYLLAMDIDLTMAFQDGRTVLHIAAERSHINLLEILLDRGCSASQRDFDGQTALHLAILSGESQTIEFLGRYQGGLLLNTRDHHGRTPLHLAVRNAIWTKDLGKLVLLLLQLGADVSIRSFADKTPLEELSALNEFRGIGKDKVLTKNVLLEDLYKLLQVRRPRRVVDAAADEGSSDQPIETGQDNEWEDYESDDSNASGESADQLQVYRYNHRSEREEVAALTKSEKRRALGLWHQYVIVISELLSGMNRKLDAKSFISIVPLAKASLSEYKMVYERYMQFMKDYCVSQGQVVRAQADSNLLTFLAREWSRFSHAMDYSRVLLKNVDFHFVKRVYNWSGRHPETTYELANSYWWKYVAKPVKKKLEAISNTEIEDLVRAKKFSIYDLMGLRFATRGAVKLPDSLYSFEQSRYGSFSREVARALDLKWGEAVGALSLQAPHRLSRYTPRESEPMFN